MVLQHLFISYSRRELPFVDYLAAELEKAGHDYWLDYHNLIPGSPWNDQIHEGIRNAETMLLVISESSMASPNVKEEWEAALAQQKRLILLIFEGTPLPAALEGLEWVDFRTDYDDGYRQLFRQLSDGRPPTEPPPTTGFRAPWQVWLAVGLSSIAAIVAWPSFWALITAWVLIPLPYQIVKRNYNFTQAQMVLFMTPLALYATDSFLYTDFLIDYLPVSMGLSAIIHLGLWQLLRGKTLQRWGKPAASALPKLHPEMTTDQPAPRRFYLDHDRADLRAATSIRSALKNTGHTEIDNIEQAEVVLSLVSAYKTSSIANPENQMVYPVILQTPPQVDEILSKLQWIDFRRGLNHLDILGHYLSKPKRLLTNLGIRPQGNQAIMPPVIQYMLYFLLAVLIFMIGSFIPFLIQFFPDLNDPVIRQYILRMLINLLITLPIGIFATRGLIRRKGFFGSYVGVLLALVLIPIASANIMANATEIVFYSNGVDLSFFYESEATMTDDELEAILYEQMETTYQKGEMDFRGESAMMGVTAYLIGIIPLIVFAFLRWKDLVHWFPVQSRLRR